MITRHLLKRYFPVSPVQTKASSRYHVVKQSLISEIGKVKIDKIKPDIIFDLKRKTNPSKNLKNILKKNAKYIKEWEFTKV